jgi:hypothetical protein
MNRVLDSPLAHGFQCSRWNKRMQPKGRPPACGMRLLSAEAMSR